MKKEKLFFTLILDKKFSPINIYNHKKTLTSLFDLNNKYIPYSIKYGNIPCKYFIYHSDELSDIMINKSRIIKTINSFVYVPEILIYQGIINLDLISKRCYRKIIYLRDHFTCQYCGKKLSKEELTLDHVHPKSKNGSFHYENIVTACRKCNLKKGNKTLEEANMKLIKKPKKLSYIQVLNHLCKQKDPILYKKLWYSFFI